MSRQISNSPQGIDTGKNSPKEDFAPVSRKGVNAVLTPSVEEHGQGFSGGRPGIKKEKQTHSTEDVGEVNQEITKGQSQIALAVQMQS
jgi:hypothetical protein